MPANALYTMFVFMFVCIVFFSYLVLLVIMDYIGGQLRYALCFPGNLPFYVVD